MRENFLFFHIFREFCKVAKKMYRNYNTSDNAGGYINRAIDMSDESTSSSANSSTTININRSRLDQQTLYHEMMYKQPQKTSCKSF